MTAHPERYRYFEANGAARARIERYFTERRAAGERFKALLTDNAILGVMYGGTRLGDSVPIAVQFRASPPPGWRHYGDMPAGWMRPHQGLRGTPEGDAAWALWTGLDAFPRRADTVEDLGWGARLCTVQSDMCALNVGLCVVCGRCIAMVPRIQLAGDDEPLDVPPEFEEIPPLEFHRWRSAHERLSVRAGKGARA